MERRSAYSWLLAMSLVSAPAMAQQAEGEKSPCQVAFEQSAAAKSCRAGIGAGALSETCSGMTACGNNYRQLSNVPIEEMNTLFVCDGKD